MNTLRMSREDAINLLARATGTSSLTLYALLEEQEELAREALPECDDKTVLYNAVRSLIEIIAGGGS